MPSSASHATPHRLRRLMVALLLPLLTAPFVGAVGHVAEAAAPAATTATTATSTPYLPFDLPSTATLRASRHKVFANWVSSLPISLDNKNPASDYYQTNYLSPSGENGKHAAYGGYLRDRPAGRSPLATGDWRLEDMKTEVRQAISEGIDGFVVVIYSLPATTNRNWDNVLLMLRAAAAVDPGFKIIPMPDTSGGSTLTSNASLMAKKMAELGKYSAAYRVDGKMVLSPFTAENGSPAWWSSVMSTMAKSYGVPTAFFPLFQDEQKWAKSFASITYGMANWGVRNPMWNNPGNTTSTGPVARADKVQAMGKKWMQPVSFQDVRPREGRYWEPENTQNLRNTWEIARKSDSDWVQLTTWNDLPEGSGMGVSAKHGYAFLDISAYYLSWYKTGVAPTIKRDAVYLTHRKQKISATTTFKQSKYMANGGGSASRDTVEALTFSKAAGVVQVTTGGVTTSCAVDAGVDTCVVPLRTGTVSARLTRSGATVASLTSPYAVTATPYVQDFEYTGSSSLRQGT